MVGEDKVIMRVKALRRVPVLRQPMEKPLTQVKAGPVLRLTPRPSRRLIARVEQAGDQGWRIGDVARHRTGGLRHGSRPRSDAVREAVGGFRADAGGRDAGRAPWDRAFHKADAAPSGVAGTEGACG